MKNSQLLSTEQKKMFQQERIQVIQDILKNNGFVTVKYLTEILHYSNATINRDLNVMEKRGLVKRSYGGVEFIEEKGIPLPFRYEKMKVAKRKIAQKAAEYVEDGDVIFIAGSTTTEYMGEFLLEKKDLTVITNNMALVLFLSEYGVKVICLGGSVVEKPYMLCGPETVENIAHYKVDKMFFSTGAISMEGVISFGGIYELLLYAAMQSAREVYYLADHGKIRTPLNRVRSIEELDYIIVDFPITASLKETCKDVVFVEI